MNLKKLGNSELLSSTEKAVKEERRATMVMLHHLREIERRRLYKSFGFASLFSMMIGKFGYSEASAQRRINAMRLIRDVPEAKAKIESGELSLSSAASVQSFFKEKNISTAEKGEVIKACLNKSTRMVEKELASRNPEADKREDIRYTKSDRLRMSLSITEDLYARLEVSKFNKGFKTVEELLHHFLDQEEKQLEQRPPTPAPESKTRYISSITKKIVIKRNPEKLCEYIDPVTNERCKTTEDLQFDHRIPFSRGGPNIAENLRQYCGPHNRHIWNTEQKFETNLTPAPE